MRWLIIAAAAVAAVVLFAVLRPSDSDEPTLAPSTTETATTSSPTTSNPPPPAPPQPVLVRIVVRGGKPVGGVQRPSVAKGKRVRLVIRSDVADEVHLHGYDLMDDVGPGEPARLSFRATVPGRFEIELEERGIEIAELEVRP